MKKNEKKCSEGVDKSRPATYSVPMSYEDLSADELAEFDAWVADTQAEALDHQMQENE